MPTEMEEDSKPSSKPSIEVKQLQRYYTVLRDFMAHFHQKDKIYPPNHEFTQDELGAVTPKDIIKWMNVKLYNKENPGDNERPINGSHHTLDYYKKSISYFMPKKEVAWSEVQKSGNPTRSTEVNNLIKKIKSWDEETGGAKKRKSTAPSQPPLNNSDGMLHDPKKARASLPPGFAPQVAPGGALVFTQPQLPLQQPLASGSQVSHDRVAMQNVLRRMHHQNTSFIDMFGTISRTLEQFKNTLMDSNNMIYAEIARINDLPPPAAAAPAVPKPALDVTGAPPSVSTGMLDWQYVHADGVRRRVPPTWQFPHANLQEMYILWHCGDYQNRISPMKLFESSDVNFLGKRARMNLNEVRNLMATIDEETTKKGNPPMATMSINEATKCFQDGLSGFNFSATTPTGKTRNILRLKWSTLTKYHKGNPATDEEKDKIVAEDEEKARKEFIKIPDASARPNDNWFYEHEDGIKRRVPSTWKFPMLGLSDMYVLWHCGDPEQKISPMKLFTSDDIQHLKRAKTNLSEVRAVMTIVDLEAVKRGCKIKNVMTVDEAMECCRVGHIGLNIPSKTVEGRTRDVMSMKWSSAVRLKDPEGKKRPLQENTEKSAEEAADEESDGPEAEETELAEPDVDV